MDGGIFLKGGKTMSVEGVSGPKEPIYPQSSRSVQRDWSKAQSAYNDTVKEIPDADQRHAEVGILTPDEKIEIKRLGKQEEYGSHRVGSVTKTFTTFLALKLIHDGVLPNGLSTKCDEKLFDQEFLKQVFEKPDLAKEMTLEQLLSHTAGMENKDHCRDQKVSAPTLYERFTQEAKEGRKYRHIVHPGDRIGCYSNAGLAVAGLMLEKAYNDYNHTHLSFAQIMQKELFEQVFDMRESVIKPGPTKDPIQSPAGDMSSSVPDLLKAARKLQQGEKPLEKYFGEKWQEQMLKPRDLFNKFGLGCEAGSLSIEHKGLNRELFGNEERDVSSIVIFPLSPKQPGLAGICDSNALGPAGEKFIDELEAFVTTEEEAEEVTEPPKNVPLKFYYPPSQNACVFQGDAYFITDCDPFKDPRDVINCSFNGMECTLTRDPELDNETARGYRDQNDLPWLIITTEDEREIILGECLLNQRRQGVSLEQPDVETIRSLAGEYRNAKSLDERPFTFTERDGNLFIREGTGKDFPCLYIPEKKAWVTAMLPSLQFQIPENPSESPLVITDIFTGDREPPYEFRRK
jgi:hypothetical protein